VIESLKLRLQENGTLDLMVRARPHAAQSKLIGVMDDGSLKIDLAAPAEDGKGNAMLVRFLAEIFDVPFARVKILSGKTARLKLVRIIAAEIN
jgi:uncharacterized protein